jgi:type II secretory pathway component PulF
LAFNHIIPSFATLYESLLGGINQLNPITRSLVIVGEFFRDWFFFVFIFVVVALTSYLILRKKTETLKEMEGWLLMRIPLVNRYVLFSNVYSWLTTLLLLLDAGSKDPVETVREASKTVENRELRNACFRAVEFMETKAFPDIQDAMAEAHPCFGRSSVLFRVLKQYFTKTGNVKEIDQFAEEVRKKMRAQQETLLNLVEPVVLCICAPITLWIVLGLYLPLFELIGKFGAK